MTASPLSRPEPINKLTTDAPAMVEAVSNVTELIRRLDQFQVANDTSDVCDVDHAAEECAWAADARGLIVEGGAIFGDNKAYRLGLLDYDQPELMARILRRHAPFHNQRVRRRGGRILRLSGNPYFHPVTGAFLGYRGCIENDRKPDAWGVPSDTMADVAHEVKTPLNAILGYAEMIDREVLGPAPERQRAGARAIITDAKRLLAAVDALGDVAALEGGQMVQDVEAIEPTGLLSQLNADFVLPAGERGVRLAFDIGKDASALHAEPTSLIRAVSRLLTAILAFSPPGSTIVTAAGPARLSILKPQALMNVGERILMEDRIALPKDADAPLLGLAFTLRILKQLAAVNGGSFSITARAFELYLPAAQTEFEAEAS